MDKEQFQKFMESWWPIGEWEEQLSRFSPDELEHIKSEVYDRYRHYPLWTLNDAIILLYDPIYLSEVRISCCDDLSPGMLVDMEFLNGSIETGKLNVIGYDREKVFSYEDTIGDFPFEREAKRWKKCYGYLKVKPADFLSFVQQNPSLYGSASSRYPARIPPELESLLNKGHTDRVKIHVPKATRWFQIHFRIVSPTRIEIKTPDGMDPYHPDDLGFTTKIWNLFERFASDTEHTPGSLDGLAGKLHRSKAPEYINAEKSDISRLRVLLKKIFPAIEGNPILHIKTKGYKAEFHILEV